MVQAFEHCGILHELGTRLSIFDKTLISTMKALSHVRHILTVLTDVCTAVTQLTLGIISLLERTHLSYQNMHVLASHEVNSLIVPPSDLRNILLDK